MWENSVVDVAEEYEWILDENDQVCYGNCNNCYQRIACLGRNRAVSSINKDDRGYELSTKMELNNGNINNNNSS